MFFAEIPQSLSDRHESLQCHKQLAFGLSECSAGVSPASVSRSMAGETPALQ
jgi:hypothetical protein